MANDYEHQEQKALFKWAALLSPQLPGLELLFAIPNGGHRHLLVAKKMKAEGVKTGVPDMCLPVARGRYHGLFIELKRAKGGKASENQKRWLKALRDQGYLAKVCHGWVEAKNLIEKYLEGRLCIIETKKTT
jgi:hypothetical protein